MSIQKNTRGTLYNCYFYYIYFSLNTHGQFGTGLKYYLNRNNDLACPFGKTLFKFQFELSLAKLSLSLSFIILDYVNWVH